MKWVQYKKKWITPAPVEGGAFPSGGFFYSEIILEFNSIRNDFM